MEVVTWKEKIKKAVDNKVNTKVQLYMEDTTSVYHFTGDGDSSAIKELDSYRTLDMICSDNGWIEVDLDHMDHKRAMATVTHRVETDVDTILKAGDNQLVGWIASFDTELGHLNVECK